MKKYYEEINIARGLGVILVVLGHAFPDSGVGMKSELSRIIYDIIYSFHMPLFIFIAGFVAVKILEIDREEKIEYIKQRVKRLLIPYLTVGILYLPLKIVIGKKLGTPYDIKELWMLIIGKNPDYAMWTLWVLFMMAVIAVLAVNKENLSVVVIITLLASVVSCYLPYDLIGINRLLLNSVYYFLGIMIATKYISIKEQIYKGKLFIICSIVTFILFNFIIQLTQGNEFIQENWLKLFTAISGILITMFISIRITEKAGKIRDILNMVGKYSMDIYIISTFVQPFLKIILWSKLGMNYALYVLISTLGGILISIFVSKVIVRNVPVIKKLILGMK